ncbi:MAG: hypothetical protein CMN32_10030 [Saprospirales bacterium]|nr:hypothetical protein [Saprospirales bacterium]
MRLNLICIAIVLITGCQKGPVSVSGVMVPLELLESSHHQGFDYTGLLAKALKNDENAFKELIAFEVQNDTTVANQHAAILLTVLERLGDETFAQQLGALSQDYQKQAWEELDRALSAQGKTLRTFAPATWKVLIHKGEPVSFLGLYKADDLHGTFMQCGQEDARYVTYDETGALQRNYIRILRNPYPGQSIVAEIKGYSLPYFGSLSLPDGFRGFLVITEIVKIEAKNFRNTCIPFDLWALGNEPFWQAQVSEAEGVIEFHELGVERTLNFPYVPMVETDSAGIYASVNPETGDNIELQVLDEPCGDSMSDNKYRFKVIIKVNGKSFRGCGLTYEDLHPPKPEEEPEE